MTSGTLNQSNIEILARTCPGKKAGMDDVRSDVMEYRQIVSRMLIY